MLTAHLLGGFSISDPNGRDVSPRSRKARGLLGYLLLSDLGAERREKLAGLLWSESPIGQAYGSLRQCIAELRRLGEAAGVSFLDADRQNVRIDRARIKCDVTDLKASLAAARIADCRHILSAPDLTLMPGVEADDPTFDNWLLVERERNAEILVQEMLALLQRPGIEPRDRVDLARAIERLDPYQEDAVRIHMEQLAAEGNIAGATAYFERYRARLLREYEVEPSEELVDFAEGLATRVSSTARKQKTAPAPAAAPAAVPSPGSQRGVPVIAVLWLPGASMSEELRQVVDAFAHALISTLCRFKDWTVIAATESVQAKTMKSTEAALDDLAERGVDYALLTSITSVAGASAINVRLLECENRAVLISDQYPASSQNWLATLNDICCRIASRTQISLTAARLRRSSGNSAEQKQAYDLWLEGEVLSRLFERETQDKAIDLFSQALQLDPSLSSAYGAWAAVLNSRWIVFPGLPSDERDREQAYQLAKRAVALDPLNSRNQVDLGFSHLLARRFDPAELHFGLAYDLNPSNPDNVLACALANAFCGNHARAKNLCSRAFDLNPFPQPFYYGYRASIDFLARDFAGCIDAINRAPDVFPDIQAWAASAQAHRGDLDSARAALGRFFVDIRKHWAGPPNPDEAMLLDWFVNIFPLRKDADRRLLADGLNKIATAPRQVKRR
jgi:DNA-binding SARP family transcriptional activator/TolB-like protein